MEQVGCPIPVEDRRAAVVLFDDRLVLAERFAGHLAGSGVDRGLLGPREVPRLWERHLLNCAAVTELIPIGAEVADVGSGAGLPGVVLAIARPDLSVTLIEPLLRRTGWLAEVVTDLGLTSVTVHRGRAEHWSGGSFDLVTARAVAELGRLWGWCRPLLRPGGRLLAVKGESVDDEVAAAQDRLSGATGWRVHRCGEGLLARPTLVAEVTRDRTRRRVPTRRGREPGPRHRGERSAGD